MAVGGAVASPASADEGPEKPVLRGTVPASPSTETRPAVVGAAEGEIVISGIGNPGRPFHPGATRDTKHPDYLISIYAQACDTPEAVLVGEGSAAELESQQGIRLSQELPHDAETPLYAKQTDPSSGKESECSNEIFYQQVSTAPDEPTFTESFPSSPAGSNAPALVGSAPDKSTVAIFADADCSGAPLATGSASTFGSSGIFVSVADNTTTVFHATAELAGLTSECSTSSLEYQEVSAGGSGGEQPGGGAEQPGGGGEAPREQLPNPPGSPDPPKLRTAPEGPANDDTPTITGKAPGAVRVEIFDGAGCRGEALAAGSAAQFASGLQIKVSDNTSVALYGVSVDGGGDRSACTSDPVTYVEDSTPPHIRFTSGPGAKTRKPRVLFTFADTTGDPSTSLQCRLDHRRWSSCHSPLRLRRLGQRRHLLRVRGIDAAGNVSPVSKRRFKVVGRR